MHMSGGSQFELSPEQLEYVRKTDRKAAALLIEIGKRERVIAEPPAEFDLAKRPARGSRGELPPVAPPSRSELPPAKRERKGGEK